MRRAVILATLAAASPSALADDIVAYQTEGAAPASSADARVMALDQAFATAVTMALGELVAPDVRVARKGELDKEVVSRARLWVTKFSVTKDETIDDRRELTVSVRVDRDKLRARLAELGIRTRDASGAAGDGGETSPGDSVVPQVRTATVLLRVLTPAGVLADYGKGADKDVPGLGAMTNLLRGNGFAVRRAPTSGPAAHGNSVLPLTDEEADALASEAKADVVAIAGVKVDASVPVRGLPTSASLITASLRVFDRRDRKLLGQASAVAAAKGDELGYAIDRALVGAAADVLPPAPAKLGPAGAFRGDDRPIGEPGVVLVRLPARTPFATVLLAQKHLAGAKGVRGASLRRLSPSGWVIGVSTSEPIEQVARIAKKPPTGGTTASVKIIGDIVELTLTGGTT
jgi:hypothetical protein